jgi:predicted site-specific integrase-resolvase
MIEYTTYDIRIILGVDITTVQRWLRTGKLKSFQLKHSRCRKRIYKKEFRRFMREAAKTGMTSHLIDGKPRETP